MACCLQPRCDVVTLFCSCSLCCLLAVSAVPLAPAATDVFPHHSLRSNGDNPSLNQSQVQSHIHASDDRADHSLYVTMEEMSTNSKIIDAEGPVHDAAQQDHVVALKVIAIVSIVLASLAGVLPPIIGWNTGIEEGSEPRQFFWLRSFSAGIMIALALIHVIAESFDLMDGLCDYPIAAIFVLAGLFVMLLVERISMDIMASRNATEEGAILFRCNSHAINFIGKHKAETESPLLTLAHGSDCAATCQAHVVHESVPIEQKEESFSIAFDLFSSSTQSCPSSACNNQQVPTPSTTDRAADEDAERKIDPVLMLSMMEVGIVVHSVVIGLNLGVMTDNPSALLGLIIALSFHQLFEGVGFGACVAAARIHLHTRHVVIAVLTFVCTLPLGVGGGMLLISRGGYDAESTTLLWLRGSLDGVSGGILLYIALVHFIAEDFSRIDVAMRRENFWLRWQMLLSLFLGAASMAVLGIWA